MYNSTGVVVGVGAAGTQALAMTGSSVGWLGYSLAAAAIVIGGLMTLRTYLLKRRQEVAGDAD
ncbi:hypothetical protein [Leifsonia shinshuensis]|uniref:hypothetical protein n=1 Tax=Leifsonia TaxID=110932 RepID=UPI00285AD48F|nr:hypothetical protein [Leifsonia shinshuensis]MDR6971870.1 hypothetical protein [Leifsonia shinshuensis]